MITTGATIEAAADLLRLRRAGPDIVVAATHGLLVHAAANRLRDLDLQRVLVSDTVAQGRDRSDQGVLGRADARRGHRLHAQRPAASSTAYPRPVIAETGIVGHSTSGSAERRSTASRALRCNPTAAAQSVPKGWTG